MSLPMWNRQREAAAGNAEAILRAARELFAQHDVENVDVRQIAKQAGVGVGTVYRRFTDKAGLLAALLDEPERALQDAILRGAPPLGPGAPALDRIIAFLAALIDLTDDHLDLLAATEAAAPGARLRVGAYAAWHTHLTALIGDSVADPDWVATLLLAPFDAELFRHHRRTREQLKENYARAATALLTVGKDPKPPAD